MDKKHGRLHASETVAGFPLICRRCGISLALWDRVVQIRMGVGYHVSKADDGRAVRCEVNPSCMICGLTGEKAIVHQPSGAFVCMECMAKTQNAHAAEPATRPPEHEKEKLRVKNPDQIVLEWVTDPKFVMADGSSYWAFSIYVGDELASCGSADDLETATSMMLEAAETVQDGTIWKGVKVRK